MRYTDLEHELRYLVQMATPAGRSCFGISTIKMLRERAAMPVNTELSADERALLMDILERLNTDPPDNLAARFEHLRKATCADEIRAIEFHPDLTELLCALDSYIKYRRTQDPAEVVRIAISAVNSVDYAIDERDSAYSLENILASPAMAAEYERQRRLLTH